MAKLAGYSVRLIGKAEAGKPLSMETIEVLAETLSTEDCKISTADLMLDPIAMAEEYVNSIYIFKSDVVSKIGHLIAPNFELRVVSDRSVFPFERSYYGNDGLASYYHQLFTYLQVTGDVQNGNSCFKIFGAKNEVVVWNNIHLTPTKEHSHELILGLTTNLIFEDGYLARQVDRFAASLG